MEQRIVCAANRGRDGDVICGVRHFDRLMKDAIEMFVNHADDHGQTFARVYWLKSEQGFVDNRGEFLTRQQAWVIAEAAGQIIRRCGGDDANGGTLYSENLY